MASAPGSHACEWPPRRRRGAGKVNAATTHLVQRGRRPRWPPKDRYSFEMPSRSTSRIMPGEKSSDRGIGDTLVRVRRSPRPHPSPSSRPPRGHSGRRVGTGRSATRRKAGPGPSGRSGWARNPHRSICPVTSVARERDPGSWSTTSSGASVGGHQAPRRDRGSGLSVIRHQVSVPRVRDRHARASARPRQIPEHLCDGLAGRPMLSKSRADPS